MNNTTEFTRPMGVENPQNKYRLWNQTKDMDIICAVCDVNKQLTEILSINKERMVSHTYCQGHFEEEREKIRILKLNRK